MNVRYEREWSRLPELRTGVGQIDIFRIMTLQSEETS
jgi:hypothetical protein